MQTLTKQDRMQLMRFVCSFAWADLEIQQQERDFIAGLMERLELTEDEKTQVQQWLRKPPRPEDVDPARVPKAHRQLFLDTARQIIEADGTIATGEQENYRLFKLLLRD